MNVVQSELVVETTGRGLVEITREMAERVRESGIETGMAQAFCKHTSASLILNENADPTVRDDFEYFMGRTVADGDPAYLHAMEGPDDMSAHIRSILTGAGVSFPITAGRPALGTWQGVFLWEHRTRPQRRQLVLTLWGA